MARVFLFLLLIVAGAQQAGAAIVRIPDGDCAALSAVAASQPGSEPALIVLAARGHYDGCKLAISGTISVDGAGASLSLQWLPSLPPLPAYAQIEVAPAGRLTLRNINLGNPDSPDYQVPGNGVLTLASVMHNAGSLTLDSVSISGFQYSGLVNGDTVLSGGPLIRNDGNVTLRNVSFARNLGVDGPGRSIPMIYNSGTIAISHSTFALNSAGSSGLLTSAATGNIAVANSLFANAGSAACATGSPQVVSLGGNVSSDNSCRFSAAGDHVVADAGVGTFGDNGGLASTVLLNGSSAAVRNGIAANCEAADARGVVRNVTARGGCDSGAYESGGGRGLLSEGGMNGFFYDAAADGHYITVQRLDSGSALVIWNTFDRSGQAAWIYAIGEVSGNHIHAGGAQNLGGVLQPGGAPTGAHGIVWGDIDIDLQNCFSGTFSYSSPLANFGSGQFPLNRLAFLGDLGCSN